MLSKPRILESSPRASPNDAQAPAWWDAPLIEATVTRHFVCERVAPGNVVRLDQPLGFGDGLTDGTYWEWIDEKAKRIFLILLDLGLPDQIFNFIDESWYDDDLPIPIDQVGRLPLTFNKDDKVAKRFYARQHLYLVSYVERGKHIVYRDDDVIPVCVIDKRQGLAPSSSIDRIELPNKPGEVFARHRFPLGSGPGKVSLENIISEINSAMKLQNDHLASVYASYIHQGCAYVIISHTSDLSLKALLSASLGPLKPLMKEERRRSVMNWIHCLTDTLCYLHRRGRSHGNIKPSTIMFCHDYYIFYTSVSRLGGVDPGSASEKTAFDRESYDFAAPEQWYRPASRRGMTGPLSPASASSESTTFSISRGGSESGYSGSSSGGSSATGAAHHSANPLLDPQAADIFSLGCVILELIGFLLKRQTRAFASHRAAKHKLAGRGGAVLDSSFHKNLGQVESWMSGLAKEAAKKSDTVFRGVTPMLQVVARMLSVLPQDRPTAPEVEQAMYKILRERCGIAEPHCVHQYDDLGLGRLRIDPQSERFNIATKRAGGSSVPRPGSRVGGHRRSTSNLAGDMVGSPPGSGDYHHHVSQEMRSSPVRTNNNWQGPMHTGSPTYLMGTY
ncbi:protein kinase [Xylariaceae sp. FL0594]|nr:protein kinase [Xylariaceae sp. FL0594]